MGNRRSHTMHLPTELFWSSVTCTFLTTFLHLYCNDGKSVGVGGSDGIITSSSSYCLAMILKRMKLFLIHGLLGTLNFNCYNGSNESGGRVTCLNYLNISIVEQFLNHVKHSMLHY